MTRSRHCVSDLVHGSLPIPTRAMPSASKRAVSSSGSTLRVCSASAMAPSVARAARAQAQRFLVERDFVTALDAVGEARLDLGERDRRRQHDAGLRGAAGQFGDRDERLARQRRGWIDIAAAAVGERERSIAAVLRDAVRVGEREDGADRLRPSPALPLTGEGADRSAARLASSLHRFAIARASLARRERSRRKLSTPMRQVHVVAAEPALGQHRRDVGGERRPRPRAPHRPPCGQAAAAAAGGAARGLPR